MLLRHLTRCLLLCVALATVARADVIVNVGDLSLPQGSSGLLPVFITGTAGQIVSSTSFDLQITTGGVTRLEFMSSPSPASDPTFSASNYVFSGNSFDQSFPLPPPPPGGTPLGTASMSVVPGDTFRGGDLAASGPGVDVSTGSFLLGYIPVTAIGTGLPPVVGDTFTVSLISGPFTSFLDSAGGNISFSSIPGTVTIISSLVPEPSSWALALIGLLSLAVLRRRRAAI